ncbi:MAG: class I SAM-dependent methyltransferase [Chitinophagales bacterium]|nr:class I SAM-dependent methyltransferase [Chitinophagales bacterium]
MFSKTEVALKYLNYFFTASNSKGHGAHSPFVFRFITQVLNDKAHYSSYNKVEELRSRLLKDETILPVEDFGAGSVVDRSQKRSIASIARNAAKPKKYGQLLFRMVKYYKPKTIVELGTSLGLTTAYLSLANPGATILTFEGAKAIAGIAKKNFDSLNLRNIKPVEGNFDDTLGTSIAPMSSIDLAFFDGNHRLIPTVNYFNEMLPKCNNSSILIMDDIHWSKEMEEAWDHCRKNDRITLSIDLFFLGILFFRPEILEKQHFRIRF